MTPRNAPQKALLSKSRYMDGVQCPKALWLKVHEPDAAELVVDARTEVTFLQGNMVGEEARLRFPGGALVDAPHRDFSERLRQTRAFLADGRDVIFEAAFSADGIFCAVDVLRKTGDGWDLIEVKSSSSLKEHYVLDAAVQLHVLRKSGIDVRRVFVMHLNRECRFPDLSNLFVLVDVTADAEAEAAAVPRQADELRIVLKGSLPIVETGPQCHAPHECAFVSRCEEPLPKHHITELYRKSKLKQLQAKGLDSILDIPAGFPLSETASRQRRAVQSGRLVVEPGLRAAVANLKGPLAHLDFETVMYAIPRFTGCKPWQQVPAQASIHFEIDDGLQHRAFLAEPGADPRPAMARFLVESLSDVATIVVWFASFERTRILELADAVPELAQELRALTTRIVDLMPIVQDNIYHPEFRGSFSLKAVAPALVQTHTWEDLEVGEGGTAAALLFRFLTDATIRDQERAELRTALLDYCERDTLATARVAGAVRELAATHGAESAA